MQADSLRDPLMEASISLRYGKNPAVLDGLRLSIAPGEILGLIGESGSGKSSLALALMKLHDSRRTLLTGRISLKGRDLVPLSEREMRRIRGSEMALVLQSAGAALNPHLRIGSHMREAWNAHSKPGAPDWKQAASSLFERVRLPATEAFLNRFPREISIGQAQRVLIAMALLHRPSLLIADEPTSALDAITHADILTLLRELNRDLGLAILLISHDLLSVASIASRIAILQGGKIIESGSPRAMFERPENPYTRSLISAIPPHPLSSNSRQPEPEYQVY